MASGAGKGKLSEEDPNKTYVPVTVDADSVSASGSGKSPQSDARKSSLRLHSRETTQTLYSGDGTGSLSTGVIRNTGKPNANDKVGTPIVSRNTKDKTDIVCPESPFIGTVLHDIGKYSTFGNTGRLNVSHSSSKSQKSGQNLKPSFIVGSQEKKKKEICWNLHH